MSEKGAKHRRAALLQLALLIGILVGMNVLGTAVYHRFDLTQEKRFSLSQPTKDLLTEIDDVMSVTLYLDGELTPNMTRLKAETLDMLKRFRSVAGSEFYFNVFDPSSIPDENNRLAFYKELQDKGMLAVEFREDATASVSRKYLFPYAEISSRNGDAQIVPLLVNFPPYLDPTFDPTPAVSLLEYSFAQAIRKAIRPVGPRIAFVEGHGELDTLAVYDTYRALADYYRIDRFDLNLVNEIDTGLEVLIFAKPTQAFSQVNQFKIDQYLMRGGKMMFFLDGVVASFDSLNTNNGEFFTIPYDRGIENNLFQYGVRVNNDLIQDLQCARIAVPVADQYEFFPWYYRPIFTNSNLRHPITRHLEPVEGRFVSTIDTAGVSGLTKTVLLRTSAHARTLLDPIRVRFSTVINPPRDEQFNKADLPVAVLVEGKFRSAYRTRKELASRFTKRGVGGTEFIEQGKASRIIVVGDGDMIRNEVSPDGRIAPLGMNNVEGVIFSNMDFILNSIEYLADGNGLAEVRAKEVRLRPLDSARVNSRRGFWTFVCIVAPLLILLFLGGFYNVVRYRRYAMVDEPSLDA